jgi:hypothetical protein
LDFGEHGGNTAKDIDVHMTDDGHVWRKWVGEPVIDFLVAPSQVAQVSDLLRKMRQSGELLPSDQESLLDDCRGKSDCTRIHLRVRFANKTYLITNRAQKWFPLLDSTLESAAPANMEAAADDVWQRTVAKMSGRWHVERHPNHQDTAIVITGVWNRREGRDNEFDASWDGNPIRQEVLGMESFHRQLGAFSRSLIGRVILVGRGSHERYEATGYFNLVDPNHPVFSFAGTISPSGDEWRGTSE